MTLIPYNNFVEEVKEDYILEHYLPINICSEWNIPESKIKNILSDWVLMSSDCNSDKLYPVYLTRPSWTNYIQIYLDGNLIYQGLGKDVARNQHNESNVSLYTDSMGYAYYDAELKYKITTVNNIWMIWIIDGVEYSGSELFEKLIGCGGFPHFPSYPDSDMPGSEILFIRNNIDMIYAGDYLPLQVPKVFNYGNERLFGHYYRNGQIFVKINDKIYKYNNRYFSCVRDAIYDEGASLSPTGIKYTYRLVKSGGIWVHSPEKTTIEFIYKTKYKLDENKPIMKDIKAKIISALKP